MTEPCALTLNIALPTYRSNRRYWIFTLCWASIEIRYSYSSGGIGVLSTCQKINLYPWCSQLLAVGGKGPGLLLSSEQWGMLGNVSVSEIRWYGWLKSAVLCWSKDRMWPAMCSTDPNPPLPLPHNSLPKQTSCFKWRLQNLDKQRTEKTTSETPRRLCPESGSRMRSGILLLAWQGKGDETPGWLTEVFFVFCFMVLFFDSGNTQPLPCCSWQLTLPNRPKPAMPQKAKKGLQPRLWSYRAKIPTTLSPSQLCKQTEAHKPTCKLNGA